MVDKFVLHPSWVVKYLNFAMSNNKHYKLMMLRLQTISVTKLDIFLWILFILMLSITNCLVISPPKLLGLIHISLVDHSILLEIINIVQYYEYED